MSNPKQKILIIHDRFQYRGGGERLVLVMARALNADIVTEYWDEKNSFPQHEAPGRVMTLGKPTHIRGLGYMSAQWRFFWQTSMVKDYDTVIFSGNNCLSAAWRARGKRKIMYCHHPVRFAFDLKKYYYRRYAWWQKPLFLAIVAVARVIYRWGIKKMDVVTANSQNVKERLQKLVGVAEVTVVYPPIDTEKFHWQKQGDYYLSFARLVDLKRVDQIVRAFTYLPDKKLIVASGGPELERIQALAAGHDNITVLGFVDDAKLSALVGGCIASVYVPVDEDFGMSPLEAASAGKPTIGVDEGGLKETILHKKTGYLLQKDFDINDIRRAVLWLTPARAAGMSGDCRRQAEAFSNERFIQRIKFFIHS